MKTTLPAIGVLSTALGLLVPADAAEILMVTGDDDATQSLTDTLALFGHTVTRDARNDGPLVDDATNFDLVLVARATSSGAYDDGTEPQDWNALPIPIISMAPHIMRSNRWGWVSGDSLSAPAVTSFDDPYLIPNHPLTVNLQAPETTIFSAASTTDTVAVAEALPEATIVGTYSAGVRMGLYMIPPGTTMGGSKGTAGAVRIGYCAAREETFGDTNYNGKQLLRNIIDFVLAPDDDGDGLSNDWETAHGLNPNEDGTTGESAVGLKDGPDGAAGDFDSDGLSNIDEYYKALIPNDNDSDDDGVLDGPETNTGTFVDTDDTGTSPYVVDTDDDGLDDGMEDGSTVFTSTTDTGTDPNNPDTDDDGLLDGVESKSGDFVDVDDTGTDPHEPDTDFDGMDDGFEVDNMLDPTEDGTEGETEVGLKDGPNGADGDPDADLSLNLDEFTNGTDPQNQDTDGDTLWDGWETGDFIWVSDTETGTDPLLMDTDGDGFDDNVETNSGEFVDATNPGTNPNLEDTDGDGMFDGVEVLNGLNPNLNGSVGESEEGLGDGPDGPDGDPDYDGSTNSNEILVGTDAQDDDTDDDGLKDGVEDNLGSWLDEDHTGTDPLNPDSDGDCLLDGVETNTDAFVDADNTGTDPNELDTDLDGFADGTEVLYGTDPTDDLDVTDIALLPDILFVGNEAGPTPVHVSDGAVDYYLKCRYGTEAVEYMQSSVVVTDDGLDRDVIITSSTPGSGDIRNKFHNLAVPVLNWEEAVSDSGGGEFGMALNMIKSTTMTQMDLVDHPITAGLTSPIDLWVDVPGETTGTANLFAGITPLATAVDGTISGGAGTIGDPFAGAVTLFVAELGDRVIPSAGITGNYAPARRVMFPMADNAFARASDDFRQLFGQAVDWAMAPPMPAAPHNLSITQTGPTSFELDWDGGDGTSNIEASESGEAGSWGDIEVDVAPPVTITADPDTVPVELYRVYEPEPEVVDPS